MTHFEYDLAFRAVIGLAGCAIALVAMAFDSRDEKRQRTGWRYTTTMPLETGVNPTRIDQ